MQKQYTIIHAPKAENRIRLRIAGIPRLDFMRPHII